MNRITVERVKDEAKNVRTLFFRWDQKISAGQFVMVWLPGLGEIPMSLSYIGSLKGITVKAYGKVSQAMIELQPGHGFPHDLLDRMDLSVYRKIYVCGPEQMLYRVMLKLRDRHVNAEFSLERTMKCGIGICDSCSVGGLQVCKQGPVFSIEQLKDNPEFGIYRTTYSGKRISLNMK